MQIISLNTWGGRAGKEKLLRFFKTHADTTGVFCLQEIWSAAYTHLDGHLAGGVEIKHEHIMTQALQEISAALPEHTSFFRPHFMDNYGLLMMVRKDLEIVEEGEEWVYKHKGHMPEGKDVGRHARNIQYATIKSSEGPITIINFHGLWAGVGIGKVDTQERLEQSDKILAFIENLKSPIVFCGDFNLLPDTESLRKFEDAGLRNLIKEFRVTSTRTSFYRKPEKFADYAFISKGIILKDFKILPHEVSDHAPLLIDVE